jgi:hypothetical protein
MMSKDGGSAASGSYNCRMAGEHNVHHRFVLEQLHKK